MTEIKLNQELEFFNVLSFRGKVTQAELGNIEKNMEIKLAEAGVRRVDNPITVTFGVEGSYIDVEILLPIDRKMDNIGNYCFKDKIKIVNAVVASFKGNPSGLQCACDKLNEYIRENRLQPITAGYNVTKKVDPLNIDNTEIDVYVGINPNIL